jgi:phage shock protein A
MSVMEARVRCLRPTLTPTPPAMKDSRNNALAAAEDLRGQLAGIDIEITAIEQQLADRVALLDGLQEQAMAAVKQGDDVAAKAALMEHTRLADLIPELDAELTVLRALGDACREALAAVAAKTK